MPEQPHAIPDPNSLLEPQHHVEAMHPLRRRLGSAIAGTVLLATGGIVGHEIGDSDTRPASAEATPDIPSMLPLDETISQEIDDAIRVDACETKVDAADVKDMYQRLFGQEARPLSLEETENKADRLISDVQDLADKLELRGGSATSPESLLMAASEMYTDNASKPYSYYADKLRIYLDEMGIQLVDNQEDADLLKGLHARDDFELLDSKDIRSSLSAKAQILSALQGFAHMPKEVVRESKLQTIVIGRPTTKGYGGKAYGDQNVIGLSVFDDPKPVKGQLTTIGSVQNSGIMHHEVTHLLDSEICEGVLGMYVRDNALNQLNRQFVYSEKNWHRLEKGELVDGKYSTPGFDRDATTVVSEPYGAKAQHEDIATLLGEHIFDLPYQGSLFMEHSSDMTVLQEKTALLITRLAAKNETLGAYYAKLLEAQALLPVIYAQQGKVAERLYGSAAMQQEGGVDPNAVPAFPSMNEDHPEYEELKAKDSAYASLSARLQTLTGSGGRSVKDFSKYTSMK